MNGLMREDDVSGGIKKQARQEGAFDLYIYKGLLIGFSSTGLVKILPDYHK